MVHLEAVRCHKCMAVIFEAYLVGPSVVRKKCSRCKTWNTVTASDYSASENQLIPDGRGGYVLTRVSQ